MIFEKGMEGAGSFKSGLSPSTKLYTRFGSRLSSHSVRMHLSRDSRRYHDASSSLSSIRDEDGLSPVTESADWNSTS